MQGKPGGPYFVNRHKCMSLKEASAYATQVIQRPINITDIHRILTHKQREIPGLRISMVEPNIEKHERIMMKNKMPLLPLLRYPKGEGPLERGLSVWS